MINHDFRRQGIGGSDVAAILGISPWQTPLGLWHYIKQGVGQKDNAAMKNGRELEGHILDVYEKEKDIYLLRNQPLVDEKYPVLRCNVDGIQAPVVLVEVKTAYKRDGWGEEGTQQVPNQYTTQVAYCRSISNVERVDFAVKFADDERIHYYYYEPNVKFETRLREDVLAWWDKYIVGDVKPAPFDKNKNPKLYQYDLQTFVEQKHLTAPPHIFELHQAHKELRAKRKAADQEMKEIDEAMRAWIKENEIDGKVAVHGQDGKQLALQYFHNSSKIDKGRMHADGVDVDKYIVNKSSLALKIN